MDGTERGHVTYVNFEQRTVFLELQPTKARVTKYGEPKIEHVVWERITFKNCITLKVNRVQLLKRSFHHLRCGQYLLSRRRGSDTYVISVYKQQLRNF